MKLPGAVVIMLDVEDGISLICLFCRVHAQISFFIKFEVGVSVEEGLFELPVRVEVAIPGEDMLLIRPDELQEGEVNPVVIIPTAIANVVGVEGLVDFDELDWIAL